MDITNLTNVLAYQDMTACGFTVPGKLAYVVSLIIMVIQYAVPLLLIIWGMLDLGKAVIASKEDEIKKGQQTFIKRIIAAVIVFFVVAVTKLVVNLAANDDDRQGITNCIDGFVNYYSKNR